MTEKKPIIGIIANQRADNSSDHIDHIPWTYVPTGFVTAVQDAGGMPLLIPMTDDEAMLSNYLQMVDKLILIGGQHVDPSLYGQEKAALTDDYFPERDQIELKVIKLARQLQKPLFTVCRGTQLVNVALGGSLNQNIDGHWQTDAPNETPQTITILEGTDLAEIYGQETLVNSYHQQSVAKLGEGLRVIAQDRTDGTIEAIESTLEDFKFLGVQWHPEHLHDSRQLDHKLFEYIVHQF